MVFHPDIKRTQEKKADKNSIDNREKSKYSVEENAQQSLTAEEQAVLRLITKHPVPVDEVIAAADLPAGKVLSVLTMLAMKGAVKNHPGKCISLK